MSSLLFHSDYDGIEGWDTFGDRGHLARIGNNQGWVHLELSWVRPN